MLANKGIILSNDKLYAKKGHLRDCLVMASIGQYSEPQYLNKLISDALGKEQLNRIDRRYKNYEHER